MGVFRGALVGCWQPVPPLSSAAAAGWGLEAGRASTAVGQRAHGEVFQRALEEYDVNAAQFAFQLLETREVPTRPHAAA